MPSDPEARFAPRSAPRAGLVACALLAIAACVALTAATPGDLNSPGGIDQTLAMGPHAGSCSRCHSEHGEDQPQVYAPLLVGPNDNSLCAGCHVQAWSGGSYPGEVLYGGSAHANAATAVWPGPVPPARAEADAAGKCLNCHDPHGFKDNAGLIPNLEVAREEQLCLTCHDGAPANTNIESDLDLFSHHPVKEYSGRHQPHENTPNDFGYAPINNRHAECEDCHNPHVARADDVTPTADVSSKSLLGVSRVAVLNNAAGQPPTYIFIPPQDTLTSPAGDYQLCFKCHSSWTTQPPGQSDFGVLFNTNNASYHPVEGLGRDLNISPLSFEPGWDAHARMRCGDCHGSDMSLVRGPHGSSNPYLLRRPYTMKSVGYPLSIASNYADPSDFCFSCHAYTVYADYNSPSGVLSASRFNPPGAAYGHVQHVGELGISCYACHNSHGAPTLPHLLQLGRQAGLQAFTQEATGATCTPSCHLPESYAINYPR